MKPKSFAAVKLELVTAIMAEIFGPYQNYLNDLRLQTIKANAKLASHPNAYLGFTYHHRQYTETGSSLHGTLPNLDASLHAEFQNVVDLIGTFEQEWRQVNQGLSTLFARGESMQDMYDLLPQEVIDVLGDSIPPFRQLFRTRPEAYAILNIPFQYDNYQKVKQLLHQYIGNHLII